MLGLDLLLTTFFYVCFLLSFVITILILYLFTYEIMFQSGWFNVSCISSPEKKHVLITGCDSGIGFLLACSLDKVGCPVFAACLTEEGQRRVTEKCSTRVKALFMDVTKIETIKSAYDGIAATLAKSEGGRYTSKVLWCLLIIRWVSLTANFHLDRNWIAAGRNDLAKQ